MRIKELFSGTAYLVATGLLATLTMDLGALVLIKSGIIQLGRYQIVPNLLGRWLGSFPTGKIFHETILETPPLPQEKLVGILAHYLIGLTLASLLVFPCVRLWRRKITLWHGVLFGVATCVLPYFLMFPAMGFGVLGMKLSHPTTLVAFSALNHAAFGAGISIWSNLLGKLFLKRTEFDQAPCSG